MSDPEAGSPVRIGRQLLVRDGEIEARGVRVDNESVMNAGPQAYYPPQSHPPPDYYPMTLERNSSDT